MTEAEPKKRNLSEIKFPTGMPNKSPTLTFPKIYPFEAVRNYRISKNFTNQTKIYPEFDVVRQHEPFSNLGILQSKLALTNKVLRRQRRHLGVKRQELDAQWKDIEEKEKDFRENFERYETFVRENAEKRARAQKKIKEDKTLAQSLETDVDRMKLRIQEMTLAKAEMDTKIRQYQVYEDFLENTVQCNNEFSTVQDLINRYLSLIQAKSCLAQAQEQNLQSLENARNNMLKVVEEKNFIIMGLNNQIANLQARFEAANIKSLDSEQLVLQIKNNAIIRRCEFNQVKSSIWNMYTQITTSKKHQKKVDKEDVEQQLMYIKRALTELVKVNSVIRRRLKMESSTKLATMSNIY